MIVLGDISGIQNYLFDVAEVGGGQAQRLRARSFFVQLLAETAALRVLRALKWPLDSIRLSGAGKFLLEGSAAPQVEDSLIRGQQDINEWLLRETRAELRLTLAWDSSESGAESYSQAQRQLQTLKARPWAPQAGWGSSRLILAPLDTPCSLCAHAPASESEWDRDTGEERRVCRTCAKNREIGRRLPDARWLVIREKTVSADFELFGFGVEVANTEQPGVGPETVAIANLRNPDERPSRCPPAQFLNRRLMAHVPTDEQGTPVWFTELARQAQGDRLLAVLKADADSLGVRFQHLLETGGLEAMSALSEQLDEFFAGRLRKALADNRERHWRSIYTIFAGGDDLVMVGPWNVMVDFAGQMREWFQEEFRGHGLTLSAGLVLIKPKRPIKFAVAEAERLLEQAKDNGKDRLAAFGEDWEWQHHDGILRTARQLVEWVNNGDMERGWLHTLLELAEARHGSTPNPLATARLAYHVGRNYRRNDTRQWAENLVRRFDNIEHVEIRYLPAIVRYALTATRTRSEEE
jgi:CRISPR-associated protein Csm1